MNFKISTFFIREVPYGLCCLAHSPPTLQLQFIREVFGSTRSVFCFYIFFCLVKDILLKTLQHTVHTHKLKWYMSNTNTTFFLRNYWNILLFLSHPRAARISFFTSILHIYLSCDVWKLVAHSPHLHLFIYFKTYQLAYILINLSLSSNSNVSYNIFSCPVISKSRSVQFSCWVELNWTSLLRMYIG